MVARISVKTDVRDIERLAEGYPRAAEIAAQRALLHTGRAVQRDEVAEMQRVFEGGPTRFTRNAFRVRLDKDKWSAHVEVKDGYWSRSDDYLNVQIVGGARKHKAFENALRRVGVLPAGWYVVPGEKAALDAYGNVSVGQIRQILSWFDAAELVAGSMQNMRQAGRDKRRRGTRSRRGFEYFVAQPGHRVGARSWMNGRRQNLEPGIYRRTSFAFAGPRGGGASAIEPILIFVRSASYKPRFDFYGVAERTVSREFKPALDAALQRELDKVVG